MLFEDGIQGMVGLWLWALFYQITPLLHTGDLIVVDEDEDAGVEVVEEEVVVDRVDSTRDETEDAVAREIPGEATTATTASREKG